MKRPNTPRWLLAIAAVVCLLFVSGLRDVAVMWVEGWDLAPRLPETFDGPRDATVLANVVDEKQAAVPNAVVRIFSIIEDQPFLSGEGQTDSAGAVEFRQLPRGETWILAYGESRSRASTRLILDAGARQVTLALLPARRLEVVVVDENEKPLPNVKVRAQGSDPIPHLTATNPAGLAIFDRLGPPPFIVLADAPGYDQAVRTGVFPGRAPLRIRLERLGMMTVRVVDADGRGVPSANVLAVGSGLWPAQSTETDDKGVTRISGLRAGAYDLKARKGTLVSRTEFAARVKHGEETEVELVVRAGRMITVTVSDGDESAEGRLPPAVPNASVGLVEEGLSSFPLYGRTDDDGIVVLGPIAAGRATASARAEGFVPTSAVLVDEEDEAVRVPLLRGGSIIGEVVDDRDYPVDGATLEVIGADLSGMPISESTALTEFREDHFDFAMRGPVALIPVGELGVMPGPVPDIPRGDIMTAGTPQLGGSASGGQPWVTNVDGSFRLAPVTPGQVQVIARHPSYVEGVSEIVTLAPGGSAKVRIVLRQGGRLEGRVVESNGRPVGGARVELASLGGGQDRVTYAADDGTFVFAAAPAQVLLTVSRPEDITEISAQLVVDIPDRERKEITIELPERRKSIAIRVTDDRNYPLDRVEITAMSLTSEAPLRRTVFSDQEGLAELPSARGLPLRLRFFHPNAAPMIAEVDIAPGTLHYTLRPPTTAEGTVTGNGGRERLASALVTAHTETGPVRVQTDEEGDYVLRNLAPGPIRLTATAEGYVMTERLDTIVEQSNGRIRLEPLDLPLAGAAEGEVLDERGDPIAGVRVALDRVPTYLPMGPLPPSVVTTDSAGHFILPGLPPGEQIIEVFDHARGRAFIEGVRIDAGRTNSGLRFELPPSTSTSSFAGSTGIAVTLGERDVAGGVRVVVVMVPPGGEAEAAAIEPGDVILEVGESPVRSLGEARRLLTGPLAEDVLLKLGRTKPGGTFQTWRVRARRERVR